MNDEQINRLIAEACGWKYVNNETHAPDGSFWRSKGLEIPDYCNDLNAMHEVEMTLANDPKFHAYEAVLDKVVPLSQRWIFATARQRAEAFLRTIGKWEEGKP